MCAVQSPFPWHFHADSDHATVANPSFGLAISFFEVKSLVETIKLEFILGLHCKLDGSDRVFPSVKLKVQTKQVLVAVMGGGTSNNLHSKQFSIFG